MRAAAPVHIPRLNANEDQVLVVRLHVADGDRVAAGDLLLEVETTKATAEVPAPRAGCVTDLAVREGTFVDVGSVVCTLADGDATPEAAAPPARERPSEPRITAKARRRARELGIDIGAIETTGGRITAADVEAHASAVPQQARDPNAGHDRRALIFGGGGHAAVLIDALEGHGYALVGCVDDDPALLGRPVLAGIEVAATGAMLADLVRDGIRLAFLGVGGATSNDARMRVFRRLLEAGFDLPPVVHRAATLGQGTTLGAGSVVLAGAVVGPRCRIGANVIVNQGAQVCHDSVIADHAHITPGALVAGSCRIGAGSVIGMGAALLFGVTVGQGCVVHNNASVNSDVPDHTEVHANGRRTSIA